MAKPKADIGDFKKIKHADFEKLQLRIGTIARVKPHPTIKKDYILLIDTSAADEDVQVVAALADGYTLAELIGKQVLVLCNIEPEMVGGEESQGMLLITHIKKKPVLLGPWTKTPPGTPVSGIMDGTCVHFGERDHNHG